LFGASPVLEEERRRNGERFRHPPAPSPMKGEGEQSTPLLPSWERGSGGEGDPWPHYALARALLRSGEVDRAAAEAERAVQLQPPGLWPIFSPGWCAYPRGGYAAAVTAFSFCIGAAPDAAGGYYNRALAFAALGQLTEARRDDDRARRLDPTLPPLRRD